MSAFPGTAQLSIKDGSNEEDKGLERKYSKVFLPSGLAWTCLPVTSAPAHPRILVSRGESFKVIELDSPIWPTLGS